ncbi:hypothetical protein HJC23_001093 [Cyclotella cryptica]|uniref:Palmitoyltransferase n=1 Tax=Cyclotella cryptica TaxID=29204 RepID=A0ABD3QIA2_9STRA
MLSSGAIQFITFSLIFVSLTYACIIADPRTSNIARFCTRSIPSFLLKQGGLQIVYLVIVLGSWSIIFTYGYKAIDNSNHIHSHHKNAGYLVFALCMTSWRYASSKSPGNVTARTIPLFDHYEYDNLLYTNRICPTLQIRKVARSKFDRYTKAHVPRFDHFCGWLNQAIGEQNYRWFLLFLMVHFLMCVYGSWAMAAVLHGDAVDKKLLDPTFLNADNDTDLKIDYIAVLRYFCKEYPQIMCVLLLMTVVSVILGIFLCFHLYITAQNMTTNEFFKWRQVKQWHKKETQKIQLALKYGKVKSVFNGNGAKSGLRHLSNSDVDVACTGPLKKSQFQGAPITRIYLIPDQYQNIFTSNKGVIENFVEVFKPLSFRQEAIQRYRTTLEEEEEEEGNPAKWKAT